MVQDNFHRITFGEFMVQDNFCAMSSQDNFCGITFVQDNFCGITFGQDNFCGITFGQDKFCAQDKNLQDNFRGAG